MFEAEAGDTGRSGDDGALHGHRFQGFQVGAGGDDGGDEDQVGVAVKRADVGGEAAELDAGEGGRVGPVAVRVWPDDDGSAYRGVLGLQHGPHLLDEAPGGADVGEVAGRSR